MKKTKRLLATLTFVAVVSVVFLAAPASALNVGSTRAMNTPSHFFCYGASGTASPNSEYLNLEGTGLAYNHRSVTRASRTNSPDQMWYFSYSALDNVPKVYSAQKDANGNTGYTLNLLRSTQSNGRYKCDIYRETSNDPNTFDSDVTYVMDGDVGAFKILMVNYNTCLTPESQSRNLYWAPRDSSLNSNQLWNKENS